MITSNILTTPIRIGLIGAGANTRSRHIPGLRALPGVELAAVCNRRAESTAAVAAEFDIPHTFTTWHDLITSPHVDAVVIGTWPYLHAPITLAAIAAGIHVLTEARLSMNAAEARAMLAAAESRPDLVCQVVPSPFGLVGDAHVRQLIESGYLGELRHVAITGHNNTYGDESVPLHWRQDATLSGLNALTLGILYETATRWVPPATRVFAQAHAFVAERLDASSGLRRPVGTPDSLQAVAVLADGARAVYQLSGVTVYGGEMSIRLLGRDGVIHYDLAADRIFGASRTDAARPGPALVEIPIPAGLTGGWTVEADFVASIRERKPIGYTDFPTAVGYMEFTEAVARSCRTGTMVDVYS